MTINEAQPHYKTLGAYIGDETAEERIRGFQALAGHDREELKAAYSRIDELETALGEARLQLEYLHEKFQPTGTTEAILARIDGALS